MQRVPEIRSNKENKLDNEVTAALHSQNELFWRWPQTLRFRFLFPNKWPKRTEENTFSTPLEGFPSQFWLFTSFSCSVVELQPPALWFSQTDFHCTFPAHFQAIKWAQAALLWVIWYFFYYTIINFFFWHVLFSSDCSQIQWNNREHLPNWNICLLVRGAGLWRNGRLSRGKLSKELQELMFGV